MADEQGASQSAAGARALDPWKQGNPDPLNTILPFSGPEHFRDQLFLPFFQSKGSGELFSQGKTAPIPQQEPLSVLLNNSHQYSKRGVLMLRKSSDPDRHSKGSFSETSYFSPFGAAGVELGQRPCSSHSPGHSPTAVSPAISPSSGLSIPFFPKREELDEEPWNGRNIFSCDAAREWELRSSSSRDTELSLVADYSAKAPLPSATRVHLWPGGQVDGVQNARLQPTRSGLAEGMGFLTSSSPAPGRQAAVSVSLSQSASSGSIKFSSTQSLLLKGKSTDPSQGSHLGPPSSGRKEVWVAAQGDHPDIPCVSSSWALMIPRVQGVRQTRHTSARRVYNWPWPGSTPGVTLPLRLAGNNWICNICTRLISLGNRGVAGVNLINSFVMCPCPIFGFH